MVETLRLGRTQEAAQDLQELGLQVDELALLVAGFNATRSQDGPSAELGAVEAYGETDLVLPSRILRHTISITDGHYIS